MCKTDTWLGAGGVKDERIGAMMFFSRLFAIVVCYKSGGSNKVAHAAVALQRKVDVGNADVRFSVHSGKFRRAQSHNSSTICTQYSSKVATLLSGMAW